MAVLLGETLPSFNGPLQTVTFNYKPPYEVKGLGYLPSSKPADPQAGAWFGQNKSYGFAVDPPHMASCCQVATVFFANITNYDSSSRTLYFEAYIRGAKYCSGSSSISGNTNVRFYAYPSALYWADLDSATQIYFWTNSPTAVLHYVCIYTIPSRLSPKPGYLFKDVTYNIIRVPTLYVGSDSYTVYAGTIGSLKYTMPTSNAIAYSLAIAGGTGIVTIPYLPTTPTTPSNPGGYGLFRADLGDFSTLNYYVTATNATQIYSSLVPASVSFRITPFKTA